MAKKEMHSLKNDGLNIDNQLKLFSANVYQDNTNYSKILQQIKENDPDVILLLETNKAWEKNMDVLIKDYPHCLKKPLENTYGLLFYSRFEIVEGKVNFLVEKDVPSVEATIVTPGGKKIKVWGLHPKPPVPGEDNRSTAKDKELMKVALKAKDIKGPVVVMGDLNDVAWSYVTELFRKTSQLLDPRRGRGFYSTFSANHWYMRFPLDYVFCSSHFGLLDMKRLNHNGSDHFAMFIHLQYQEQLSKTQKKPKADAKEKHEAEEKAAQAA
jgi:endonuclease/exonuclease/phosphatase (EEP) superfamily protein YafD